MRQEPVKRKWTPKRGLFHAKQYYVRSMRRRCWIAALTYMVTRPEFLKKKKFGEVSYPARVVIKLE